MSINVTFDSQHPVYTNLDTISGKVILSLGREESFTAIVVKLECESRSRLSAPRNDGRRPDIEFELHKLLYRVQTVFPTQQLLQAAANVRSPAYLLQPGEHQFPFNFKFPFNNACAQTNSMLMMGQDFNRHVKKTLPPNLSGFPGEASIRYFVKVTAQRSGIFKENYRQEVDLKFMPIEDPRPPPNKRETYARRQHQFAAAPPGQPPGSFLRGQSPNTGTPPRINIDGRLPDPPIITAHDPVPLRVLVKKLNETPEIVFLKSFHLVLVGFTSIRAHYLERVEQNTWVIASNANLQIALGNSNTPIEKDVEIDKSMWASKILPSSVPPTFETCNIKRWYELRVELGLAWGSVGNIKSELSVQALRMPVDIYSGIKPPAQLLNEMGYRPGLTPQHTSSSSTLPPHSPFNTGGPVTPPANNSWQQPPMSSPQHFQPVPPTAAAPHDPEGPIDDPPPSYEDAIAADLPPVDGQRRDYDQPRNSDVEEPPAGRSRSKGERLFGDG